MTWRNTSPFTEQEWRDGSGQIESGVISSPYSGVSEYENRARELFGLAESSRQIGCKHVKTPFAYQSDGRGEIALLYCGACQTVWGAESAFNQYRASFPENVRFVKR